MARVSPDLVRLVDIFSRPLMDNQKMIRAETKLHEGSIYIQAHWVDYKSGQIMVL